MYIWVNWTIILLIYSNANARNWYEMPIQLVWNADTLSLLCFLVMFMPFSNNSIYHTCLLNRYKSVPVRWHTFRIALHLRRSRCTYVMLFCLVAPLSVASNRPYYVFCVFFSAWAPTDNIYNNFVDFDDKVATVTLCVCVFTVSKRILPGMRRFLSSQVKDVYSTLKISIYILLER